MSNRIGLRHDADKLESIAVASEATQVEVTASALDDYEINEVLNLLLVEQQLTNKLLRKILK